LAIPPTQVSKISFSPLMTFEREQLSQRLYMGSFIKIVIFYRTNFWREKGYSGELVCANEDYDQSPVTFTFDSSMTHNGKDYPALVCFITGKASLRWSDANHEDRKRAVLLHLARLYGDGILRPVEYIEKDWNADPWTRYCSPRY
jgi:monoamine oxidase